MVSKGRRRTFVSRIQEEEESRNDYGESFTGREFPSWLSSLLIGGAVVSLLWLERKRPLRTRVEPKLRHDTRNLVVGALSALTIRLTEKPLTDRLTQVVEKKKIGLVKQLNLSPIVETALAIALLDYTLYLWHVLTHKNKFLWRFHEVHHEDLDLTTTTAIRFHVAEMAISAVWRSAQVLSIGASPKALSTWQTLTLLEILFHHSNRELSPKLEKALSRFVVTPRMHAIHHSTIQRETDSNWSSGLTVWDWLHDTLQLDVPQETIEIGVPAYGSSSDIKLIELLKKPFMKQRNSWHPANPVARVRSHAIRQSQLSA